MSRNKYGNKKVECDGHVFDSKREMQRYCELKLLQQAGKIFNLELQKPFELLPSQYEHTGKVYTKGKKAGQPEVKCVERPVKYIADFVYTDENGIVVVEDVKGIKTKEYIIKRKLFRFRYPLYHFREVK